MPEKRFPNGDALYPAEATPRISLAHAKEVMRLIEENDNYPATPAILIAVWTSTGLVKYLVNDQEVCDTIHNLKKAAKEKSDAE